MTLFFFGVVGTSGTANTFWVGLTEDYGQCDHESRTIDAGRVRLLPSCPDSITSPELDKTRCLWKTKFSLDCWYSFVEIKGTVVEYGTPHVASYPGLQIRALGPIGQTNFCRAWGDWTTEQLCDFVWALTLNLTSLLEYEFKWKKSGNENKKLHPVQVIASWITQY